MEPPIVGIETREIADFKGSKAGFVVMLVPRAEGPPHRSRKDWQFYIRVGSSTLPMDYWQIEDRFGNRPHPKLELILEIRQKVYQPNERGAFRHFVLGLSNGGAGIAKFPGVQFRRALGLSVDPYGIDGNLNFGIRQRPSESDSIIFGGGVDDVIYPGQRLLIAKLTQYGTNVGLLGFPRDQLPYPGRPMTQPGRFVFSEIRFTCEISCEGRPTEKVEQVIPEEDLLYPGD